MEQLKPINYNNLISNFDKQEWDFSYLTYSEMMEVLNFPVKISINHLEHLIQHPDLPDTATFLIVVKRTQDYDYSIGDIFIKNCSNHFPEIKLGNFWCNYKYAAVKAGLGQYAKNSLFYHPIFGFETHLYVAIIYSPLYNLPNRNKSNFNYLKQCDNCNDCAQSCPVQAIHNKDQFCWIDMEKCDNFCMFGNHPTIPSVKWNYIFLNHLSLEEKYAIQTYDEFNTQFPNLQIGSGIIDDNGRTCWYQYPTCRECTSQKKCSKYNGHYPYDWNNVQIKYCE